MKQQEQQMKSQQTSLQRSSRWPAPIGREGLVTTEAASPDHPFCSRLAMLALAMLVLPPSALGAPVPDRSPPCPGG